MEYAAGIFLSVLSVAVLVNLRAGTLPDWLRAKFLNLAPGESIPVPQASTEAATAGKTFTKPQASPGGKAFSKPGVAAGVSGSMTPQLAQIKNAVARQFAPQIASGLLVIKGGVTSCRPMRPQPKSAKNVAYSEHSWSNAWDLYYGDRPRKYVNDVVRWIKAEGRAGRLPVGFITYGPNGNHVHIEGKPKRNPKPWVNTPPCAQRGAVGP